MSRHDPSLLEEIWYLTEEILKGAGMVVLFIVCLGFCLPFILAVLLIIAPFFLIAAIIILATRYGDKKL